MSETDGENGVFVHLPVDFLSVVLLEAVVLCTESGGERCVAHLVSLSRWLLVLTGCHDGHQISQSGSRCIDKAAWLTADL